MAFLQWKWKSDVKMFQDVVKKTSVFIRTGFSFLMFSFSSAKSRHFCLLVADFDFINFDYVREVETFYFN